jgi:hypothetical protein
MRTLEITRFDLKPWASRVPTMIGDADPTPKTPHITCEFSYQEFQYLAWLLSGCPASGLSIDVLRTAQDAQIDYSELPDGYSE